MKDTVDAAPPRHPLTAYLPSAPCACPIFEPNEHARALPLPLRKMTIKIVDRTKWATIATIPARVTWILRVKVQTLWNLGASKKLEYALKRKSQSHPVSSNQLDIFYEKIKQELLLLPADNKPRRSAKLQACSVDVLGYLTSQRSSLVPECKSSCGTQWNLVARYRKLKLWRRQI